MAEEGNAGGEWTLTWADRAAVMKKSGANRLRFVVLRLFCRTDGRFPGHRRKSMTRPRRASPGNYVRL